MSPSTTSTNSMNPSATSANSMNPSTTSANSMITTSIDTVINNVYYESNHKSMYF